MKGTIHILILRNAIFLLIVELVVVMIFSTPYNIMSCLTPPPNFAKKEEKIGNIQKKIRKDSGKRKKIRKNWKN